MFQCFFSGNSAENVSVKRRKKVWEKEWKTKGECVIMESACFKFKRICNLTHFLFLSAVGDGTGWQWFNSSNTFDFFTLTLMFPLLPMVTFKHTIFHSESHYRNMRRALCTEHRQSWTETQCCHKGCSGFTAGDHIYPARSQWFVLPLEKKGNNLNRRSLISHACTKTHRQLY